jgi:hypothetical protein
MKKGERDMLRKFFVLTLAVGFLTLAASGDHATLFKLRIENVSTDHILMSKDGQAAPAGLSPGVVVLYKGNANPLFKLGGDASGKPLERLAEDGNPDPIADAARKMNGTSVQVFNTPLGKDQPGAILPGGVYEVTFAAKPGARALIAQMFGQSNDLFYSTDANGIELFDSNGKAIDGDITSKFQLWDAGTEVNQEPGFGPDQAPRQKAPNSGADEHGKIGKVNDGFKYPETNQVLKVTITHQ